MSFRIAGLALLIAAAIAGAAAAQPRPTLTPEQAQLYETPPVIELVTMGIGSLMWERHGHIALCVTRAGVIKALRNPDPVEDRCYNYGIGDFHEPLKMVSGFFRGANSFWVGRMIPEEMLAIYIQFDRTVWVQPLPLDAAQKQEVIAKLEHDILEPNRYYAYDHFADNCTTRIRDIIDHATHGALSSMTELTDGATFRDLARDGFQGMRIPLLITDIAMGRSTDRVPNYWERMFLPQYLREAAQKRWGITPFPIYVRKECRGPDANGVPPDASCVERGIREVPAPSGRLLVALFVLLLCAPAIAARRFGRFPRLTLGVAVVPYVLIGSILTFLAAISPLPYVHWNETCLVWFPFDVLLLALPLAKRRLYARGRVAMLGLIAALLLIDVFYQPLWPELLWPLITCGLVGFWPDKWTRGAAK